ncbi:hypothetical protein AGMMS49944_25140 [Spirochaetia bacterium]|nr:hypothetical protein AGMMS49944_25140 [Spirochaetia bacterium]
MKNSKTTLLIPLFHLTLSAVFIFIFIGSIREIHSIIESMDHYRNAASEIQPLSQGYLSRLENLARDLRDQGPESPAEFSAEDGFAMIRDLLRTRDITVERFRTTGKGNTTAAETEKNAPYLDLFIADLYQYYAEDRERALFFLNRFLESRYEAKVAKRVRELNEVNGM